MTDARQQKPGQGRASFTRDSGQGSHCNSTASHKVRIPPNWRDRLPDPAGYYAANVRGRTGLDLIGELIVSTDALQDALQTLRTTPTPEGAEVICYQLIGMHRAARQTMELLLREAGHGG